MKPALRAMVVSLLLLGLSTLRGENDPVVLPDFMPVTWLPSTSAVLTKAAVPTEGIVVAPAEVGIQKTDTVTLLVQAAEDKSLRQWAVVLSINDIKPEEKLLRSNAFAIHLNTGRKVDFSPSPFEGMLIHVLGPFSAAKGAAKAKDIWSGSLVNPQFLGLGIDQTAALFRRLALRSLEDPNLKGGTLSISSEVFSPEQINETKKWVHPLAVTETEERAYAGFIPAMFDFFKIASQTPGVREIVFEILDVPWWSIVTHGGRISDIHFELLGPFDELPAAAWGLPPDARVYSMGLRLYLLGKPALNCRLALTVPHVPLLNCAGIVGFAAMRPNGKGPQLMIRVMAAKAAATAHVP
jgi:hypothetical protein